jgi:hypothetical protein
MALKPGSHANEVTFVVEHRSMASFDFCSSDNTFVLCTTVMCTHAHVCVYEIRCSCGDEYKDYGCFGCAVKLHCAVFQKIDPNTYSPRDNGE